VRYFELYLLKNRCLPLPKAYVRGSHHSLLDNEAVLHDVRVYLATQTLGTVTPRALCKHINAVILPALEIKGTIVESTAQRWLKYRLGYECKETKKGVYIDGHERPDVIVERKTFLGVLSSYERCVACTNALNAFIPV
jgi:hypothetical protein